MKQPPAPFKSFEEWHFSWYLEELKRAGFIEDYEYENSEIILSMPLQIVVQEQKVTKVKETKKTILQDHRYTPDFVVNWNQKAVGIFVFILDHDDQIVQEPVPPLFCNKWLVSYIEVKPEFDANNMTREFVINQKWAWQYYGTCINLVKPNKGKECLFSKTFTPERFLYTDGGTRPRLIKYDAPRTLTQFIYVQEARIRARDQREADRQKKEKKVPSYTKTRVPKADSRGWEVGSQGALHFGGSSEGSGSPEEYFGILGTSF